MIRSGTLLDADMASLGRSVVAGWRWWTAEMAAMLPPALRSRRTIPAVQRLSWRGTLTRPDGTAAAAGSASILIDPALALVRTIERPALPRGEMQSLLANDLDRLTPFAPGSAYVDVTILGPGSAPGKVQVLLAALPRTIATAIADACAAGGIVPRAVGLADPNATELTADFVGPMRADGLLPAAGYARPFWWAAVVALFALNLGLSIYRDIDSTRRLQALVDAQSTAASGARRVAIGLRREEQVRDRLLRDRRAGDALAMLALTSRVLPTGAWLERFAWDGTELRISGYKPAQLNLLKALRATGRFASIRTTTADVATKSSDGEPFDVTAVVAPR